MSVRYICPNCKGEKVKIFQRTKGTITYTVYVCEKCKCVIKREITK